VDFFTDLDRFFAFFFFFFAIGLAELSDFKDLLDFKFLSIFRIIIFKLILV